MLSVRGVLGRLRIKVAQHDAYVLVELCVGVDRVAQHDAYVLVEREYDSGRGIFCDSGTLQCAGTLYTDEINISTTLTVSASRTLLSDLLAGSESEGISQLHCAASFTGTSSSSLTGRGSQQT